MSRGKKIEKERDFLLLFGLLGNCMHCNMEDRF